ncbi:hypothetical protein [Lysobacter sp. D1-1-M9]|uniref:hypothetical protein n=1 Tax=Novilysobacter longmucuonensis TaxID=3098603 RepID=UPI002FC795A7
MTFYSSFLGGWGDDQGGGSVTQQELVSYDKKLWESQRQTACSEKNLIAANTSLTAAATGGACLLAETGVGAVVCVAGIVSYGIGVYQTHKKTKECFAAYPGIGKW